MKNILITSGPTQANIDPVRYIANTSTGELGTKIAKEFLKYKNKVTFIYGKNSIFPSKKTENLCLIEIITINDLIKVIKKELNKTRYDIIVHLMAVLDYVPEKYNTKKIASNKKNLIIKLVQTPKVIKIIRKLAPASFLIGFKLEVNKKENSLIKTALEFLKKNKLDMVVVNDFKKIKENTHIAFLINKQGIINKEITKEKIAKKIVFLLK
ncbi:MAG: phosphopantothenoylcysteine decarboxylase [bacterium]